MAGLGRPSRFLKVKEVVELTGFGADKVYRMIHCGEFTIVDNEENLKSIVRKLGRDYCIDRQEFEQWYAEYGREKSVKVSDILSDSIEFRDGRYIKSKSRRAMMPSEKRGRRRKYGFGGGVCYPNNPEKWRVLKDGTSIIDFWFYDEQGKRKQEKAQYPDGTYAKTVKEAEVLLNEKRKEIFLKQNAPQIPEQSDSILFKDFVDVYLDKLERDGCRSVKNRKCLIRGNMMPVFGELKMEDIDYPQVERYKAIRSQSKSRRRGTPPKNCSINVELRYLRHMINVAEKMCYKICRKGNPVQECKGGNFLRDDRKKRDNVITEEQKNRLVECSPPFLKPIIIVDWDTGMRKQELLSAKWENIELDINKKEGFIHVPDEPGNKTGARDVPLELWLVELLYKLKMENGHSKYVFLRKGKQIKNIDHAFNKAMEKAGIKDYTFHGFKHTYITRKLLEGVSPVIISKVVGTTVKVIMEHYAHIKKDDLKQVLSSNDSGDKIRRNFGFFGSVLGSTGEN